MGNYRLSQKSDSIEILPICFLRIIYSLTVCIYAEYKITKHFLM